MIDILTSLVTSLLIAYLGFTNYLASQIEQLLPVSEVEVTEVDDTKPEDVFEDKTNLYEYGGALPDILIKNSAYQKASVIDSQGESAESPTNINLADAIVNIYCTYKTPDFIKTTTGTGVVVSSNGVVLTNAHVAQFLLLEGMKAKGTTNCIIRSGETATESYEAELLYISPKWIQDNAEIISQANPKGTGERDYALLYISKGVDNLPVPASLTFVPADTAYLTKVDINSVVTIGGYPILNQNLEDVQDHLNRVTATTTIAEIFTFVSKTTDIFNLRGSDIGDYGISGGPVVNSSNKLIGLITTKNDDALLGKGSLNAITLSYIDQTMKEETGFNFTQNLNGNLPYRAEVFKATVIPFLTKILSEEL